MSRTTSLRRQHDAAALLASHILDQIKQYRGREDASGISLSLAKLLGLLSIHLAQEDQNLYPAMMASGDEHAAAVAQLFASEMGNLAERLKAFASRWSSSTAIASSFEDFRRETHTILAALDARITRENEELYPLADTLYSSSLRSAA